MLRKIADRVLQAQGALEHISAEHAVDIVRVVVPDKRVTHNV
jgi:hypothetical protein